MAPRARLLALASVGLLACTSARPPEGAPQPGDPSDPSATADDAWAKVTRPLLNPAPVLYGSTPEPPELVDP